MKNPHQTIKSFLSKKPLSPFSILQHGPQAGPRFSTFRALSKSPERITVVAGGDTTPSLEEKQSL